jgi:hypothetical protein
MPFETLIISGGLPIENFRKNFVPQGRATLYAFREESNVSGKNHEV